jgi:hypothetical protein
MNIQAWSPSPRSPPPFLFLFIHVKREILFFLFAQGGEKEACKKSESAKDRSYPQLSHLQRGGGALGSWCFILTTGVA